MPFDKIKRVSKAKILGHITRAKSNITDDVNDRLQKSKYRLCKIKKKFRNINTSIQYTHTSSKRNIVK